MTNNMTNKDIHQALNTLYVLARKAPVDADTGDVRENCAKVVNNALLEAYPIELASVPIEPQENESA